jgi:enoyl-CoA hydratase
MPLPYFGVELARHRLSPIHFGRAVANAEIYTPRSAVDAGFLDVIVPEAERMGAAMQAAQVLAQVDMTAHYATKLRVREKALEVVNEAIEKEFYV